MSEELDEIRQMREDLQIGLREMGQMRAELQNVQRSLQAFANLSAISLGDFQLENHLRYGDPRRLLCHAAQVCSQNGEDGIIQEIFRRIGTTDRVFAEVGVGDGSENNTAFLLSQGWQGFWIDGSDAFLANLEKRPDLSGGILRGKAAMVTRENVADLFAELEIPREFDLFSLDIDQNTYHAWEALAEYRPRVVVVEYNSVIPPQIDWKVTYAPDRTWDGTHNFGSSLKALENLGRRLGYSLIGCEFVGTNAFFVRNDLTANHFAEPFTAENHYEPARYSLLHRRGHPPSILDRNGVS